MVYTRCGRRLRELTIMQIVTAATPPCVMPTFCKLKDETTERTTPA